MGYVSKPRNALIGVRGTRSKTGGGLNKRRYRVRLCVGNPRVSTDPRPDLPDLELADGSDRGLTPDLRG